jgi:hypothetical protein
MQGAIGWKMPYSNPTNPLIIYKRIQMAKPSYAFQKRQKEIAKKKKKEEKLLQKAEAADSKAQDVQPISGNVDKAEPTDDT